MQNDIRDPRPPVPTTSQGAVLRTDGSVLFRVWAPQRESLRIALWPGGRHVEYAMQPESDGYFTHCRPTAEEGMRYAYVLSNQLERADPASRWQPEGVHRPSATFFPETMDWSDDAWRGVAQADLVIYELHVGTFTPEGTFEAISRRLGELAELGVTAIELMPVMQFPGERNWGYDCVYLYAVQDSYGGPRELQRLVNAAHQAGLAVVLDVVYNHLGPEGNYLSEFGPYFTDRYRTPWGAAFNFDGADSDAVRQFVIENACMWVRDFHIDGLRLDAVHSIFDFGTRHILVDIQDAVQTEARRLGRRAWVIAETNQNDVRLVTPREQGGHGLDGIWSDDFHHSLHAILTHERSTYYADFGHPEQLAKAFTDVFAYDGNYSVFRRRRHGTPVNDAPRERFVVCTQNHDQVGNRPLGDRLSGLWPPATQRLSCGLLLLSPCVPLMFMGQEYGETNPFAFFCSFSDTALVEAVRRGRHAEFSNLAAGELPDPQDFATFERAKLSWTWQDDATRAGLRRLYADLLAARRRWPALRDCQRTRAHVFDYTVASSPDQRRVVLLIERGERPS
ncbi:MAG TPA: malto-oligosyltrehalose trehalohydrolase, partial [Pirellulales bacterium]|nr:malto-oligosyltrehalose trehalohydrolase [Pirellulales bacterium]